MKASTRYRVTYSPEPEGYPVFSWLAPSSCRTAEDAIEAFNDGPDDGDWFHVKATRAAVLS